MIDFAPPWLLEWEAAALELWDSGLSSPKCAALLTDRYGHHFTSDAVYNKIRQLKKRGQRQPVEAPLAGEHSEKPQGDSPAPGKTIMDLGQWECHFEITGTQHDKRAYRFCAEPVVGEKPYRWCEKHRGVCYGEKNGRV